MQNPVYEKYRVIQQMVEDDPEYGMLERKFHVCEAELRRVLANMPEKQRHVITEYIGISAELDLRAMEIVCFDL